jgi:tubulin polyglutamylase TTLL5
MIKLGYDMDKIWKDIYDVILKSLISGEKHIVNALRRSVPHRSNCFELFGYDIMLDENLKPWLMEINLSPSLSCDTNLDFIIKSTVLVNLFNMIGFQRFD